MYTRNDHQLANKKRARRGATLVEFALVVPILFLLFFAAVEFARVAMIRHTVDNASMRRHVWRSFREQPREKPFGKLVSS